MILANFPKVNQEKWLILKHTSDLLVPHFCATSRHRPEIFAAIQLLRERA